MAQLRLAYPFIPNENYFYNNWDFNVLGAILEQATGKSVFELFKTEIADSIGMDDYLGEYSQIDGEDEKTLLRPANIRSLSDVAETWWDTGGIFACPDTGSFSARCQNR